MEIDGSLIIKELAAGEKLIVDTGNIVGFTSNVKMDIKTVPGIKNKLFGGEGLFNIVLTGPGTVYLQTMSMNNLINLIACGISSGNQ